MSAHDVIKLRRKPIPKSTAVSLSALDRVTVALDFNTEEALASKGAVLKKKVEGAKK